MHGPRHRLQWARAVPVWLAICLGAAAGSACFDTGETADPHGEDHAGEEHAAEAHDSDEHAGDEAQGSLELPEDAQRNAGVEVVTAEHRAHPVPMKVTGLVTPVPSRVVHLRPLAEGVVRQVKVELGDRVRAGQALVHYDNIALGDHIGEYRGAVAARRQAEADLEVLQRSLQRAEQLIGLEAISQQTLDLRRSEFEQARAGLVSAQAEVSRIEERIHRFGLTDEDLSEVAPHGSVDEMRAAAERHREMSLNVIRAPFDGTVTEFSVAVGDLVEPDRELLTIINMSTVWVLADVYEPDLGRLPSNAEVTIQVDAYPDRVFTGRITHISDTIEMSTRAAHVRCVVSNRDKALKLGMFTRVSIPTSEKVSTLVAPVDAVQQIDGQSVVFVRTGPTTFERRDVTLGSTADGQVEMIGGLKPGETIVSTGSFYLKTALLHERIGHSH